MSPLTARELLALRAYAETGDYGLAATRIRISRKALMSRLERARARTGVDSTVVLIWHFREAIAA